MVDKRPFVDRRIGIVILHETLDPGASLETEEKSTKRSFNEILNNMGMSAYITHVQASNNPPQERIIFNESSMKPETLQAISDRFVRATEEAGGRVQTTQVISVALSPGDKVRNAIPI